MPNLDGVLFDYGGTLVTFPQYPKECILGVLREFMPRMEARLGARPPRPEAILRDILLPLEAYVSSTSLDEVDYEDVYRNAWRRAGIGLPQLMLHQILDREQMCWDSTVALDPDAEQALVSLHERGIKRGICSNAPFPPAMMRRQLQRNRVVGLVDAVVFSSEIGRRKPAPELYRAALHEIGTAPERTLFVGDRVREDYDGPVALGMRAVIVTAHAEEPPPDGVPTIRTLAELESVL
ncbi:MAG TPA: HAD family hydrolase [Candidatus Dormibacteraeota bacterium]|nr:HAD family hydrolase [Candidatus Dormibacteraeota bacterium]